MRFAVSLQLSAPKRKIPDYPAQSYASGHKKLVALMRGQENSLLSSVFLRFFVDTIFSPWANFPLDFSVWSGYTVRRKNICSISRT